MNMEAVGQKVVRKKYSPQFKDQVLERAKQYGVKQVAKDLGLAQAIGLFVESPARKSWQFLGTSEDSTV